MADEIRTEDLFPASGGEESTVGNKADRPSQTRALGVRPLTLSFRDPAAEAAFLTRYFENHLTHGRLCHLLAILFYIGDGVRDFFLFSDAILPLMMVRYGVIVPVFTVGLIVSYVLPDIYRRHWQKLFSGYVLITGLGAIAITVLATPPLGRELYVGVIYCLVFGYTFIRLRFVAASAAGILLTLVYAMAAFGWMKIPSSLFWIHMPYLVGINLLGMFVAYSLELSARRHFHLNRLLGRKSQRLDTVNRELELRVAQRTEALEATNIALKEKIAELERVQLDRHSLERQLLQAQKLESLGTLAGGIAHDFNNILTSVIGYTELALCDADPGSELAENLNEVCVAGNRARDLVRQILTFSRQSETDIRPIQVELIVKEVASLLRSTLPATIEIRIDLRARRKTILADATQLHQVLMNLCTNASHAMPHGGKIELVLDNISFPNPEEKNPSDLPAGHYLWLAVNDTGEGMTAGIMERIFDPFFTTKDYGKGTGMGLSVVHGIVQAHHGQITVTSDPGQGTRFDIYFPLTEKAAAVPGASPSAAPQQGRGNVLLVDDEPSIVNLQRRFLERIGYRVTARNSSLEAMEAFSANADVFDILISDLTMPHMTGDQLAAEIRRIRPEMPVILCTGYSETLTEEKARELGIDRFLMKPVGNADLAAAVNQLLANRN